MAVNNTSSNVFTFHLSFFVSVAIVIKEQPLFIKKVVELTLLFLFAVSIFWLWNFWLMLLCFGEFSEEAGGDF
jgi:hypothetical protein